MPSTNIIILILFSIGIFLIEYSLLMYKKEKEEREKLYTKLDEAFLLMNNLFNKLHDETDSFNDLAENIFNEANEKHDELLTIYNLIQTSNKKPQENISEKNIEKEKKVKNSFKPKNSQSEEIFALYDSGQSIEEIAKNLSIGRGEIEFLLNLRKA